MALRIALFLVPTVVVAVLVPTLNALDANPGVAVASLGMVAVLSGGALGVFADRLPELPFARHRRASVAGGITGSHDARR